MTAFPSEDHTNEANITDGSVSVPQYDRNEPWTGLSYHKSRDRKQKSRKFSQFRKLCGWNRQHSAHCVVTARKCWQCQQLHDTWRRTEECTGFYWRQLADRYVWSVTRTETEPAGGNTQLNGWQRVAAGH